MDLNTEDQKKQINLTCLEHKNPIMFIYLKNDSNSILACTKCFVKNKLDHDYILEISDFLNNKENDNLKKLLPILSEQSQQYLDSESIKNSNKDELIEKVSKQFDEYADVILSNIEKLKKELINHIISTEDQRLQILKITNNNTFIEDLKTQILKFSDDPIKLNDQLRQIISSKISCIDDDKKKIEDSIKDHMNQIKQIDLKHIENSLESILQNIKFINILQQDHIQRLIKEQIKIESIEDLKYIPNLLLYKDVHLNLSHQNIGDQEMLEVCDILKQGKNIDSLSLYLGSNRIGDQGIYYLCQIMPQLKCLSNFALYLGCNKYITKTGVSQLTKALSQYSAQIQNLEFDLACNYNISDQVFKTSIIPLFSSCIHLLSMSLLLEDTKIGGNVVRQIANMLKSLPKLKILFLNLSENDIDDESIIYLSEVGIKSLNKQIQTLNLCLHTTQLTNKSTKSLWNTISGCQHLTELSVDLSYNDIGEEWRGHLELLKQTLKDKKNVIIYDIEE